MPLINGTNGNDTLTGTDGVDEINGLDGDDVINGGFGADTLNGGAGDDRFVFNGVAFVSPTPPNGAINGGSGFDTVDTTAVSPTRISYSSSSGLNLFVGNQAFVVSEVEVFRMGSGADSITTFGMGPIFTVYAGGGDDNFNINPGVSAYGEGGDDNFFISGAFGTAPVTSIADGGAGTDLLRLNISFSLNMATGVATSGSSTWTVLNFENVEASVSFGYDASVTGDSGANIITATALNGTAGRAFFNGGGGNDTLTGAGSADVLAGDDGDDILHGGAGDDILHGGSGNDTLTGGLGNDTLEGGSGDDVYYVSPEDVVTEELNGGLDIVYSTGSHQLGANVEAVYLLGPGDLIGGGNELSNWIYGGVGNDRLFGAGGNDVLDGGAGNDLLEGGEGGDWLRGGEGNDTLDGGIGADRMEGGLGDDVYYVEDAADIVTEAAGGGIDVVRAAIDRFILPENVEGLELQGSEDLTLYGRATNDYLYGNSGDNILFGDGGSDLLDGGAGNDVFSGGAGDDLLRDVGGGDDQFVFTGNWGNDQVRGFEAGSGLGDTLYFEKSTFSGIDALVAAWSDVDGNVVINAGNGNTVTLFGVTTAELYANDFVFG